MSAPSLQAGSSSAAAYVCDTLPAPRLASGDKSCSRASSPHPQSPPSVSVTTFDAPILMPGSSQDSPEPSSSSSQTAPTGSSAGASPSQAPDMLQQPPARKLCVRHQRMADEGTNLKLQQALDALPVAEREAVSAIWSSFSSSSHPRRALILQGLLTMCCFSQLSLLTEQLAHLIRIDPFAVLPREVSLKVLGYLDATSLCRAAQVSRQWKSLADDDVLWRGICEQHIGQKCLKCGWGLPILEKRRRAVPPSLPPASVPASAAPSASPSPSPSLPGSSSSSQLKRPHEPEPGPSEASQPAKRVRLEQRTRAASPPSEAVSQTLPPSAYPSNPLIVPLSELPAPDLKTRPWKDVYCERLTIERNWRRGRCTVRTLKGHTDGVMCLQFSETLAHPSFPVLITGSYDRTARVWNLETGAEVHTLAGHTRAIRALQFDAVKLITGSMDHTMRVWNWRTGQCVKTLEGHTEGVVCLNFDSNVLASGSVDTTVKVWNFRTGECFTLRGHCDWVNAVQLWDSTATAPPGCDSSSSSSSSSAGASERAQRRAIESGSTAPHIDPGKMLFSASDDGTIRLWDLSLRTCVRQFKGHVGQVQSLKLLLVDDQSRADDGGDGDSLPDLASSADGLRSPPPRSPSLRASASPYPSPYPYPNTNPYPTTTGSSPLLTRRSTAPPLERGAPASPAKRLKPVLISGSLDNTIKLWDIGTGTVQRTLFGHIEGVWAVASDKLRLVSGSHDRTIKVWSREEGNCTATLVGHRGAVTCLALGEDKIVSGSDDGDVRVWSFGGE